MKRELPEIFQRMAKIARLRTKREIAQNLEISPADFSNRLRKGTWEGLYPNLIKWAIRTGISLDWLWGISGKKPPTSSTAMARLMSTQKRLNSEEFEKIYRIATKMWLLMTGRYKLIREENQRVITAFIDSLYGPKISESEKEDLEYLFENGERP